MMIDVARTLQYGYDTGTASWQFGSIHRESRVPVICKPHRTAILVLALALAVAPHLTQGG
jgi:hypothetical protein